MSEIYLETGLALAYIVIAIAYLLLALSKLGILKV